MSSEFVTILDRALAIWIRATTPGGKFFAVFQPGTIKTILGTKDLTCSKSERWSSMLFFGFDVSMILLALWRPVPMLTRQKYLLVRQIRAASSSATCEGLFCPNPPST